MNHSLPPDGLPLSPTEECRIDQHCTDFERAWKSGQQPRIEDWLLRVPAPEQARFLQELILVEVELRRGTGEPPGEDEYQARFRDWPAAVAAAFRLIVELRRERLQAPTVIGSAGQDTSTQDFELAGQNDSTQKDAAPIPESIGRYSILGLLGQGKFGRVYLACDPRLNRQVAIKVAQASQFRTPLGRERFLLEARSAGRLDHPGIVRAYDVDESGELLYIVQQYIAGSSLEACLSSQKWPLDRIVNCTSAVALALSYAHKQGLIHCDLKPANILVDRDGNPYVADFGLAVDEITQRGRRGELAGTPRYMSPEQVRREAHHLDGRSDIWSLGVMLYEMTTGRSPFNGATHDELNDEILNRNPKPPRMIDEKIPFALECIILRCLAKPVAERYATALDVARDLQKLGRQSRPWWPMAAAAGGVLVILLGIVWRPFAPPGQTPVPTNASPNSAGLTSPETISPGPISPVVTAGNLIESFRIVQFRNHAETSELIGEIGAASQAAREDDLVKVIIRFRAPAYCYLIAFNPDGAEQLCHPDDKQVQPQPLAKLEYPASSAGFKLTDGAGQQAFALVASPDPLPAFEEWSKLAGTAPWQHVDGSSVIKFDGERLTPLLIEHGIERAVRGQVETLKGIESFERLCRHLAEHSQAEIVQAVAFPVVAKTPK